MFAVEKPSHLEGKKTFSFQFFDRSGNSAFNVFLGLYSDISADKAERFTQVQNEFRMAKDYEQGG